MAGLSTDDDSLLAGSLTGTAEAGTPRKGGIPAGRLSQQACGRQRRATDEESESDVIVGFTDALGAQDPEQPGTAKDRQSKEITIDALGAPDPDQSGTAKDPQRNETTQLPQKKKKRRGVVRKSFTGDQRRARAWDLLEATETLSR
jgi:hypothetical protein